MNNVQRKLRRRIQGNANAAKGKGRQAPVFNEKENYILGVANEANALSKTNQQNVVAINLEIRNLKQLVNAYDTKMAEYDTKQINPRFETIEKKIDLMTDLLLDSLVRELSEEEIRILGLEFEPVEKPKKEMPPTVESIPKAVLEAEPLPKQKPVVEKPIKGESIGKPRGRPKKATVKADGK